ncbi:MAG: ATP-binding protein [Bacteroidota bacterium]
MSKNLIGRKQELQILNEALQSPVAEMVSVIGRRRVGKTFLIKSAYKNRINFQFTGIQNATNKEQLQNFAYAISVASGAKTMKASPSNWVEAFIQLIEFLKAQQNEQNEQKQVIFIDELPWLGSRKSGFLRGLSFFWNSWAVDEHIVLVICGSAASWMIQKVVHHTGGLHNRITRSILLKPFTLLETESFLSSRNIKLNRYQIAQLYMAIGGIPHYLEKIKRGRSTAQIIDQLCFSETGALKNEFSKLYPALFANAEKHIQIIRTLAQKQQGMSRKEIIRMGSFANGGTISIVLEELAQSGFIAMYYAFGKKNKQKLYRLTDEYSLFYLQFIEKNRKEGAKTWQHLSQTQTYKIWTGYAFESLCMKHLAQMKKSLDIAGVYTTSSSFQKQGNDQEQGAQIDLLLDRKDGVINLFEMKFHHQAFTLSKSYAQDLKRKMGVFEASSSAKKQLFWTLVTAHGLKANEHSLGLIDQVLTLDDLFVIP